MDFEENLIEEVQKMPVIYNLGLENYKNTKKKDFAWKQVSSAMQSDEAMCRKRWKNLRDSYKRLKRSQQLASGSGAPSPKRKWRYMDAMSFLDNVQSSRSTTGNDSDGENEHTASEDASPASCNEFARPTASSRKETQQKFNAFLELASQSITNTCSTFASQTTETDSTTLHFQSLAHKIKEAGLPMNVVINIEAQVSALVFREIECHLSNDCIPL